MKTFLGFVLVALLAAVSANGQGSVNFANNTSTRVYYYTAGGFTFIPVGSQFTAELVFAPDGTPTGAFDSAATRVGATTIFGPIPGVFQAGNRTVASITPAGGYGLFQVRVWSTASGSDYRTALLDPGALVGTSAILRVDTADPTTVPPGTPTRLLDFGLASFCVTPAFVTPPCIPEPSIAVIGIAATAALLFFRKRSRA